jgi:hypothetical protein
VVNVDSNELQEFRIKPLSPTCPVFKVV